MVEHRREAEKELAETLEPLRERLPVYGRLFALGIAAAAGIGLVGWVFLSLTSRLGRSAAVPLLRTVFGSDAVAAVDWGVLGGTIAAIGYGLIAFGTVLLLVGGARGGGYTNIGLGAIEAVVGGRNRTEDDFEADAELRRGKVMKRRDPLERLRKGLRPKANPTAFWQAIAGIGYVAIGIVTVGLTS